MSDLLRECGWKMGRDEPMDLPTRREERLNRAREEALEAKGGPRGQKKCDGDQGEPSKRNQDEREGR